jgi:NAD(P)-dependent dehydrogenase (short-subunit alcohol dehydrogenase family)
MTGILYPGAAVADFDGKVAIVTGAAGGVGSAATRQLVERGASVVAVDVLAAVHELAGDSVAALEGDVSLAATAERAVATASERWNRVDVLVNNAGLIVFKGIADTSEEEWDRVMAVNVKSMFLFSRAVLPLMERQGGGAIVNTASISGLVGLPGQAAYCASKGAVVQLTRQLAVEYGAANIRVNAVAPGAIETRFLLDFVEQQDDPEALATAIKAGHPLNRYATADEVARSILFLASDAAAFTTGTILGVDGGFTAK